MANRSPSLEPWFMPGPPHELTVEDFETATRVLITNKDEFLADGALMKPMTGAAGNYVPLGQYPENVERRRRQRKVRPLGRDAAGVAIYPAILCTDPTPSDGHGLPLGITASLGYVGSAWAVRTKYWAEMMPRRADVRPGTFLVTRVAISRAQRDHMEQLSVWLPPHPKLLAEWQSRDST